MIFVLFECDGCGRVSPDVLSRFRKRAGRQVLTQDFCDTCVKTDVAPQVEDWTRQGGEVKVVQRRDME